MLKVCLCEALDTLASVTADVSLIKASSHASFLHPLQGLLRGLAGLLRPGSDRCLVWAGPQGQVVQPFPVSSL